MNFSEKIKQKEVDKYKMFSLVDLDEAVSKAGAAFLLTPIPGVSAKDKNDLQSGIILYMEIVKDFLRKGAENNGNK